MIRGVTTEGEPGPRSIKLSSVASFNILKRKKRGKGLNNNNTIRESLSFYTKDILFRLRNSTGEYSRKLREHYGSKVKK